MGTSKFHAGIGGGGGQVTMKCTWMGLPHPGGSRNTPSHNSKLALLFVSFQEVGIPLGRCIPIMKSWSKRYSNQGGPNYNLII